MEVGMRPLTLGEILDRTVQLYRRNFLLLIGISTLPAAVDVLISGGAGLFMTSRAIGLAPATPSAQPDIQKMLVLFAVVAGFLSIGVPILLGVFSLALSAMNFAALGLNRGETTTVRASYRFGLKCFWRNAGILALQFLFAAVIPGIVLGGLFIVVGIGAAILIPKAGGPAAAIGIGLITVGAMLLLFAACLWIWIRFCLAFPASIAEDKKVWPAMQRSAALSKGTRGRIFVMYAMVTILTMVAYYALIIPIDLAMGMRVDKLFAVTRTAGMIPVLVQSVNLVISFLERAFVMPIYAIALVLFYTDQRTRLEGYDIELLMAQAGLADPRLTHPRLTDPITAQPTLMIQPSSIEAQSGTDANPPPPRSTLDTQEPILQEPILVQMPAGDEGLTLLEPNGEDHA